VNNNDVVIAGKKTPEDNLGKLIAVMESQAKVAIPERVGMSWDRLARVFRTVIQQSPALQECTARSLQACLMQSAELGLEPGSALGHFYMVPFRNKGQREAQGIVGYRGMIDIVRRSDQVMTVYARVVYEKDKFKYISGLRENIEHEPSPLAVSERGKITHFYFVSHFVNGGYHLEVMTKGEVDDIRKRSKASSSGPWVTDYAEMGKKTVVRRAFKWLPTSIVPKALHQAIESEDVHNTEFAKQMNPVLLESEAAVENANVNDESPEKEENKESGGPTDFNNFGKDDGESAPS